MRRSVALRLLPELHARALRMEAGGSEAEELAAGLGMEPGSVGPLLRVARAKLAALEALDVALVPDDNPTPEEP